MAEANKCGCGRSPSGKCIGWHSVSEDDYQKRLAAYKARQAEKATTKAAWRFLILVSATAEAGETATSILCMR